MFTLGRGPAVDARGAGIADDLPEQRRRVVHLGREPQHRRRHVSAGSLTGQIDLNELFAGLLRRSDAEPARAGPRGTDRERRPGCRHPPIGYRSRGEHEGHGRASCVRASAAATVGPRSTTTGTAAPRVWRSTGASAPCSASDRGTRVESSTSAPGPVASRTRLRDLPFVVPVDFSQPSLRRLADKSLTHTTPVVGDADRGPVAERRVRSRGLLSGAPAPRRRAPHGGAA